MATRRIIAVSPDLAFGEVLAGVLAGPDRLVERRTALGGIGPEPLALVVLHTGERSAADVVALLARLPPHVPAIAIIPRTDLVLLVEVMRASDQIHAVLVAEGLDHAELAGLAARILEGEAFGLEPFVTRQADLFEVRVGDYAGKAQCIDDVLAFAEATKVRRKYREMIGQCLDEMLMNALYDAPVDAAGRPLFAEVAPADRKALPHEHEAIVHYACDGIRFAIAVRDAFGRLERGTVLRYLHKCLHEEQQIDRKAGGAGLGLYLMASSASSVYFRVEPGRATEAVCTFELGGPRPRLLQFGFLTARDPRTAPVASPPPTVPAANPPVEPAAHTRAAGADRALTHVTQGPPRLLVIGLAAAIALVVAAIVLVATGAL